MSALAYGPRDLPELRADLMSLMDENTGLILKHAELFFVSSQMADLALAAKDTLVSFDVKEADVPCPRGLIYFEKPVFTTTARAASIPIVGAIWHVYDGQEAMVYWLAHRDDVVAGYWPDKQSQIARRPEALSRLPLLHPIYGEDYAFTEGDPSDARLLMTSVWLLMQQSVAREEPVEYNRADKKRLARKNIEPVPVRVIKLRRAASPPVGGQSDREYLHQWIVRGHWRQQWYPARQVHRPVWIAPHVKGPEGAPMLGGEKVYAWQR